MAHPSPVIYPGPATFPSSDEPAPVPAGPRPLRRGTAALRAQKVGTAVLNLPRPGTASIFE